MKKESKRYYENIGWFKKMTDKLVTFKVPEELLADFDDSWKGKYENRSHALRSMMQNEVKTDGT
jgi:metal-responsive CopG/Arc/MetJ family transcriptional regulator